MAQNNIFFRIIRGIYRVIRSMIMTVGLIVVVGYIIMLYSIYSWRTNAPSTFSGTREDSVLVMDLEGQLTSATPSIKDQIFANLFGKGPSVYLQQVTEALDRAAADKLIHSVFIDISQLDGGLSHITAMRRVLVNFHTSKKPLVIYSTGFDYKKYFLASAGTNIVTPPLGGVELLGPASQLVYLADGLSKLGLEFEVFRAGKYKSAFEPLVANKPSEPTLEEYRSLTGSLADYVQTSIATSRELKPEVVKSWFKRSLFTNDELLKQDIVDQVAYRRDVIDGLRKNPAKTFEKLEYLEYLPMSEDVLKKKSGDDDKGIAYIEAKGEVWMTPDRDGEGNINIQDMEKQLKWAAENKESKAVVLRVDSPGGSALASEIIWKDLQRVAAVKPVVVSMGEVAASGGYYISSASQKIFAEPTTITGSIGVIGMIPKGPKIPEKFGVHFYVVGETERAGLINIAQKSTPEDKKMMDASIDEVYQMFLKRVADNRKMTVEQVHELAQGRVYTGLQAKELGLVDEIGGSKEAFKAAKVLAGLDPEKVYRVHHYEGEDVNLFACLRRHNLGKCLADASKNSQIKWPTLWSMFAKETGMPEHVWDRVQNNEKVWAYWLGRPL